MRNRGYFPYCFPCGRFCDRVWGKNTGLKIVQQFNEAGLAHPAILRSGSHFGTNDCSLVSSLLHFVPSSGTALHLQRRAAPKAYVLGAFGRKSTLCNIPTAKAS